MKANDRLNSVADCYTISTIIGFHLSAKIVPRPNLQCSKV